MAAPSDFTRNLRAVLTSRELISAFLGAVFAFLFAVAWDLIKDQRRHAQEEQRAVRLLRAEITTNIELLRRALDYLAKDSELANDNKELVLPLDSLYTRAWESLSLAGSLPSGRDELFDEIAKTYTGAMILNQRIQARELYRVTNQALTGYSQRRSLINQNLLKDVETLLARFRDHLAKLPN